MLTTGASRPVSPIAVISSGSGNNRSRCGGLPSMEEASYYRELALHARRLAELAHQGDVRDALLTAAQEFDQRAEDLDAIPSARHLDSLS